MKRSELTWVRSVPLHTTRTYIHACVALRMIRNAHNHWHRRMAHRTSPGSGMHHYQFPTNRFPCKGGGCRTADDANSRNYFTCTNCATIAWFSSQRQTLRGDDVQRVSTAKRFQLKHPLPLHPKVADAHKAFRDKGGRITLLSNKRDLPTIVWVDGTHHVSHVTYPLHVSTHKM